jgi:hypothetical protein
VIWLHHSDEGIYNVVTYSTVGLTLDERRRLAELPEHARAAYVRECKLAALAVEVGVHPVLLAQQVRELTDPTGVDCWEAYEGAGDLG